MSLLEQQNVLARLYTDAEFREEFKNEPQRIGAENGLTETEIADIVDFTVGEIEIFADSLVWKRLHEAKKLLPTLRKVVGDGLREAFFEFAPTFNPKGIKKHLEDAEAFCTYVEKNSRFSDGVKDAAKYERTRLQFWGSERRFAFCLLRRDFRRTESAGRLTRSLVIWLRVGGRVRQWWL